MFYVFQRVQCLLICFVPSSTRNKMADDGKRERRGTGTPPPPPKAAPLAELKVEHVAPMKLAEDFKFTNPEDAKIAEGLQGEALTRFTAMIRDVVELNGTGDIAGVQSSYIEVKQYVQMFDDVQVSAEMKKALFLAYNWEALGKGTGGLAGASIRWALKTHFSADRETVRHRIVPRNARAILEAYGEAAKNQTQLVNFFITNAVSVAALAGAMVNKIVHHWDAQHTGAQKAFLSAMGMGEILQEDQFRAVFYLSVHPLPLLATERMRSDAALGRNPDVAEVVRLRCVGPPAGYGAINACAAAASSLLSERIFSESTWVEKELPEAPDAGQDQSTYIKLTHEVLTYNTKMEERKLRVRKIRREVESLVEANLVLVQNAPAYHQFAVKYGYAERLSLRLELHESAMVLLTAYIMSRIKGSLAGSAAVKKFRNTHAREVTKRMTAFSNIDETDDAFENLGL